jgi:PIN domain nuclease of toxin-antitoxin system
VVLTDDPALSETARTVIAKPENESLVSVASLWEIAIKRSLGKLDAPDDLASTIEAEGFASLPIGTHHAWNVGALPFHQLNPFDRLLIAQALGDGLPVLTTDPHFDASGVEVLW